MRDVVRPGAAYDAQDAINEGFADGPQADDREDSFAGEENGASRQMPGRRTQAIELPWQSSSWPECSTIANRTIVPEVTAPREVPAVTAAQLAAGPVRGRRETPGKTALGWRLAVSGFMRRGDDGDDGGGDDVRRQRQGWQRQAQGE